VILIVKPSIALNIGAAVVVFASLAGCGQTGPLYMPTPPAKPQPTPAVPPAMPPVSSSVAQ
jgi:predicted small lipoprotein YifL